MAGWRLDIGDSEEIMEEASNAGEEANLNHRSIPPPLQLHFDHT